MKKFSFNLDSLLALRDREEQTARLKLSEVNAQVAEINRQIHQLEEGVSKAYESWNRESGRRFSPTDHMSLNNQVADLRHQMERAQQSLEQAQQCRTRALHKLRQASCNRKVVSNLRETRFQHYTAELHKEEAAEIEDIFNARRSAL